MVLIAPKLQAPKTSSRASSQKLFARHPSALPACARPSPRSAPPFARIRFSAEPPTKNAIMPSRGQVNQLRIPITSAQTAPASVGTTEPDAKPEYGC